MPLTLSGTSGVLDNSGAFIAGTAVASTSGTSITFTGIPSWVKRITMTFASVSTNGSSTPWLIQIGPSGGAETSGYLGASAAITTATNSPNNTSGFPINCDNSASAVVHGSMIISLVSSSTNTWAASGVFGQSDRAYTVVSGSSKSISGTLSVIRVTTPSGTDTFDNGTINILYE